MGDTLPSGQPFREVSDALAGEVPNGPAAAVHTMHQRGLYSMTELCAATASAGRPATSGSRATRPTARAGLAERRHVPHACPHRIATASRRLLRRGASAHPTWGPTKLLDVPAPRHPHVEWPAAARSADSCSAQGLVRHAGAGARASCIPAPCRLTTRAERPLDRRLQGPVPHARRRLLLSRSPSPTSTRATCSLPRAARHARRRRAARLRAPVSRVRAAARDPHRQRRAVRHTGAPRALAAQRLVDPARDPASADPARLARSRTARTSGCTATLKAETTRPPAGDSRAQQRAFTAFRRRVQRRAPARSARAATRQPRVRSPHRARTRRTLPAARVSGALPGQARHARGDDPLPGSAALPRQRPQGTSRRARGERRWRLVALSRLRAAGEDRRSDYMQVHG